MRARVHHSLPYTQQSELELEAILTATQAKALCFPLCPAVGKSGTFVDLVTYRKGPPALPDIQQFELRNPI